MDGVGGAAAGTAEEGIEMKGLVKPFFREDGGNEARAARDGWKKETCAEGRTVGEKEELFGSSATVSVLVENDGEETVADTDRGYNHCRYRAATDDDVREVNLADWGEAVFVEVLKDGVGVSLFTNSLPVESDEVGLLHVGREFGNHREVAAVGLLRLSFRIGHRGGHGTLALPPVPGIVYLVAEFPSLGVAIFPCHRCYVFVYK